MRELTDVTPTRLRGLPTWLVGQAHVRSHRLVTEALAPSGLRGHHFRVLAAADELGPCSQAELGRAAGLDRSDVTVTVEELERRGALRRRADPTDGRRKHVLITAPGRRLLLRLETALASAQGEFLAPLSRSERATFVALLQRLQP